MKPTLKRSPSMAMENVPFCSSTRLLAMFSPSPLPSVVRELSPRTKRSISSSGSMLSASREMFLNENATVSPSRLAAM